MRQDGSGLLDYSDCLRQRHAGNSVLYREHNKHSKAERLLPWHKLRSFFIFQVQFTSYRVGRSHNTAAWLEILAVKVGQVPLSFSPLILIGSGNRVLQLAGGKLECKDNARRTTYILYMDVCMSHICVRETAWKRDWGIQQWEWSPCGHLAAALVKIRQSDVSWHGQWFIIEVGQLLLAALTGPRANDRW